jgi:ABC-type nitrate/sulfonate/bicarbonate transport system substrate-binding protein
MSHSTSRRQLLKQSAFAGGALLSFPTAAALLSACGGSEESGSDELTAMSFQLGWTKLVQFGGHFMALDLGYFEEAGIAAEFVSGGPGIDPVADVAAGSVLMGDADSSALVLARDSGIPIKGFAAIFQRSPFALMSLAANPILSLEDMVGKQIGLPDGYRPQLDVLLTKAGIDPASVTYVPVGFDPSVLSTEQVDGYMGYATSQGVALQSEGIDIEVVYLSDLGDEGYGNVFFATEETIENKADLLARWLAADMKGWEYAVENPEKMAERVTELHGTETGAEIGPETGSALAQVELIEGSSEGLLWISSEVFDAAAQLAADSGAASSVLTSDELMTEEILKAATA